jgi:hypothetical protein
LAVQSLTNAAGAYVDARKRQCTDRKELDVLVAAIEAEKERVEAIFKHGKSSKLTSLLKDANEFVEAWSNSTFSGWTTAGAPKPVQDQNPIKKIRSMGGQTKDLTLMQEAIRWAAEHPEESLAGATLIHRDPKIGEVKILGLQQTRRETVIETTSGTKYTRTSISKRVFVALILKG